MTHTMKTRKKRTQNIKSRNISASNVNKLSLENQRYSSIICMEGQHLGFTLCISNDKNVHFIGYMHGEFTDYHAKCGYIPRIVNNLRNIKMIDCNYESCIFLDEDGNVFTLGSNKNGRLGIGKSFEELEYVDSPQKVNIQPCRQVCCAGEFSFCLTDEGTLYFLGKDGIYIPLSGDYLITDNGPHIISNMNNIEYITCGENHVICKTYNEEIYSCGRNDVGELGRGYKIESEFFTRCFGWPDNIISIKCGKHHSLLLTLNGYVYSFGSNIYGQLGINFGHLISMSRPTLIRGLPEIQRIECGNKHSMCIDVNNCLWVFGGNSDGQLGLGDTKDRYKPILHPTLSNIIDISSRGDHTFVKNIDNEIYAFGNNVFSQLGLQPLGYPIDDGIEKYRYNDISQQMFDYPLPIKTFIDNEDIWRNNIGKSRQKSARK